MKALFLALPLVYIGGNIYLYIRGLQALAQVPMWGKVLFSAVFWTAAFALFVSIGLRSSSLPGWAMASMYQAGSVWMVFLLYMVLLLVVLDLVKLAVPAMGHTFWYALPLTLVLLLYGYIQYRHPKVEKMEVVTQKGFEGEKMRIVAVSDIHLGYGTGVNALNKYVDLINSQEPDVILIAGDLIDNSIKPLLHAPFDKALNGLKAPMGIYMVPGNHEFISGIDAVTEYLRGTGIELLRDSVVTLPNGVKIVGRDDRSNRERNSLESLLEVCGEDDFSVVMDHQPYQVAQADSLGVDLLLCGHTHRGQVFPLNLLTDLMYEQSYGFRKWNHSFVWVSSGLSLWGPPFRIGTRSDLGVIDAVSRK